MGIVHYSIEEVLEWTDPTVKFKPFKTYDVVVSNLLNYEIYKRPNGTVCAGCGLKAGYFLLEKTYRRKPKMIYNYWHFNLYGTSSQGKKVLFTKDHIRAVSCGGTDELDNLQTMCETCNKHKGSLTMEEFMQRKKYIVRADADAVQNVFNDLKEGYNISINDTEYNQLTDIVKNAKCFFMKCNITEYRIVKFKEIELMVIYDKRKNRLNGVVIDKWEKDLIIKRNSMIKTVIQTVKTEYKDFGDNEENGRYFKTCTYPNLMWFHHTGKMSAFKHVAMTIIRKTIN